MHYNVIYNDATMLLMTNKSVAQKTAVIVLATGGVVPHRQRLGSCHLFIMHATNVVFF